MNSAKSPTVATVRRAFSDIRRSAAESVEACFLRIVISVSAMHDEHAARPNAPLPAAAGLSQLRSPLS